MAVKNCNDAGKDSLRDIIETVAQSGDTVDLSALPTLCGTNDGTITLASEIAVLQESLTLQGPNLGQGNVTISGSHSSRVFHHTGIGTLLISQLGIANGYVGVNLGSSGGCIASSGNVTLNHSTVSGCVAQTSFNFAKGGGIFTEGTLTLVNSSVNGNQAVATMAHGWGLGGGVYASALVATNSTISNNKAQDGDICGQGGGALIRGDTSIVSSTIDTNQSRCGSGLEVLWASYVDILESTVSMNIGGQIGAVRLGADSANVFNSTIAFNNSTAGQAAGLYFRGNYQSSALTLQSSIVANNISGDQPADVFIHSGSLSGIDNLVIAANVSLLGIATVSTDPMLGPLQFNGGLTRTHALLWGSPAIGAGNNTVGFIFDQRGAAYPRSTGNNLTTDIGAYEFDSIFAHDFDH